MSQDYNTARPPPPLLTENMDRQAIGSAKRNPGEPVFCGQLEQPDNASLSLFLYNGLASSLARCLLLKYVQLFIKHKCHFSRTEPSQRGWCGTLKKVDVLQQNSLFCTSGYDY